MATTDDEDFQGNLYGAPGGASGTPRHATQQSSGGQLGHERIASGGYHQPPAALTAAPGSVPRAHRHARTASSGAALAPSDGREARALTVVKRTVLDALPPNHRPSVLKLTEQTSRDDIANFLESAQSHSPGPSLTQMMSQRAPHQMRRQHGGHHQDARVVSHARSTSNFVGPGQYRRGGHRRTVSVQSSDGGSQQMTPEPSYDAAFASSAGAVQNSVSIDVGGPDSSETAGEGQSQGTSAAIQPRMSRRKSLAAEPPDPAPHRGAPQQQHTSPASLSAGGGGGGPPAASVAASGRCTATVGSVVVAVGIHRLNPKVAASLSEFMITGLLPAATASGANTAPQAYPGITVVALTSDPMLPALPARLRSAFTLSMTMSIARSNTALTDIPDLLL